MSKIQKVSRIFRVVFQIAFFAWPVLLTVFWIGVDNRGLNLFTPWMTYIPAGTQIMHTLTTTDRLLGFAINLIPCIISMIMFYYLVKLFRLYEQGVIFTYEIASTIRIIGLTLFINQLLSTVSASATGVAMTWGNGPGHRVLAISFNNNDLTTLLIAGGIMLTSWIMLEAVKINEEHAMIL